MDDHLMLITPLHIGHCLTLMTDLKFKCNKLVNSKECFDIHTPNSYGTNLKLRAVMLSFN